MDTLSHSQVFKEQIDKVLQLNYQFFCLPNYNVRTQHTISLFGACVVWKGESG